jgi:simple sugar transport system ATP-binding protein
LLPNPPILSATHISKSYPGVRALDSVSFEVRAGEVHALLGQNGAGKSTLIRILTGAERPDAGVLTLAGKPFAPATPAGAQREGVAAVYQELNLIPTLSLAENLYLGRQPRRWWGIDWKQMRRGARESMQALGLALDVNRPLASFPLAIQQMAAIARALSMRARVLVFDEPTSSLDAAETGRLFGLIRSLRARGLGIVFITHFLDQVYQLADRITVLRNGRLAGHGPPAELTHRGVVELMLGSGVPVASRSRSGDRGAPSRDTHPILRASNLSRKGVLRPTSLALHTHEVLALAGLLGSGRTETADLIFGARRRDSGRVTLNDRPIRNNSPRSAIRAGLGMTPEDRKHAGLFPRMSIRDNIAMVVQRRLSRVGLVSRRRHDALATTLAGPLSLDADLARPIRTLSGGNQQKALLARWLAVHPAALILDEPTRGIDIGAKAQVESLITALAGEGCAILFISAELDELARRSHRVVVLRDRAAVGELTGDRLTEPNMMAMIAGDQPGAPARGATP